MTWAIHAIASKSSNQMVTLCGRRGWQSFVDNEWDSDREGTFTGGVIETAPMNDNRSVTCKKCLKSIERSRLQGDKLGMVIT